MHSSLQTPSSTGSGRPFSTTNPFRMSGAATGSTASTTAPNGVIGAPDRVDLGRYDSDPQFQDWARGQMQQRQYQRNSTDSSLAFDNTRSPPSKSSTNPFLADEDEDAHDDNDYNSNMNGGANRYGQSSSARHVSAREEKEQLRQRYMEERDVNDSSPRRPGAGAGEMPPSYDEVPRSRREHGTYPEDKARHRSHRSGSTGGNAPSGSRSDRPRTHRHHSSGDRERERERDRHGHSSSSRREKRKSKMIPAKNVDTIDKLDVTGLFGGSFHHDGPFDACTPHRNKNNKAAPVMAFPADGPNSTIGGTFRKKSALDEIYGVDDADFDMYQNRNAQASKDAIRTNIDDLRQVDAKSKAEKVHGPTTYGLGSTTFLDGAPAPTKPLERGKSMSYRQTSFNSSTTSPDSPGVRRNMTVSSRPTNRYGSGSSDSMGFARPAAGRSGSGGGPEYTKTEVSFSTRERGAGDRSFGDDEDDVYLGSSGNGGVRFDSETKKTSNRGNSFLKRVKSLKVGGRKR